MRVEELTPDNVDMESGHNQFVQCPNCECEPEMGIIIGNGECHCCGQELGLLLIWPEGEDA